MLGSADKKAARRRAQVAKGLARAYGKARVEQVELDELRLIVFSDHHRGERDGAGRLPPLRARLQRRARPLPRDRARARAARRRRGAVGERRAGDHRRRTRARYALEGEFAARGRYRRVYGNHDDAWSSEEGRASTAQRSAASTRSCARRSGSRCTTPASRSASCSSSTGTRGPTTAERFSWLSRIVVREIWRPLQRKLGIASTTPASDWDLREQHDAAMYAYGCSAPSRPVVIAGHTHRPVFGAGRREPVLPEPAEQPRGRARAGAPRRRATPSRLAALRAQVEFAYAEARRYDRPPIPVVPPCYFNTGCCSFGDGDVTGLELADGAIRLVRWLDDDQRPAVKVLAEARSRMCSPPSGRAHDVRVGEAGRAGVSRARALPAVGTRRRGGERSRAVPARPRAAHGHGAGRPCSSQPRSARCSRPTRSPAASTSSCSACATASARARCT